MSSSSSYYTCVVECPANKGYYYDTVAQRCMEATGYTDGTTDYSSN